MIQQVNYLWGGMVEIAGYSAQLIWFLGPSGLAGIAMMIALVPIQVRVSVPTPCPTVNVRHADGLVSAMSTPWVHLAECPWVARADSCARRAARSFIGPLCSPCEKNATQQCLLHHPWELDVMMAGCKPAACISPTASSAFYHCPPSSYALVRELYVKILARCIH